MEALAWYLERSEAAAEGLMAAYRETVQRMDAFPGRFPLKDGCRQYPVPNYPYYVVLHVATERIVAVAHTSRRPGCWKDRL